jgi:hypothetical protein
MRQKKRLLAGLLIGVLLLPLAAYAQQQTRLDIKPGRYKGTGQEVGWFSVTFVSAKDALKVSEVGYKFTGSLEVEHSFLKTKQPFGTVENGTLKFQFPVFSKFSPSNSLTSAGGTVTMPCYSVEISKDDTPDQLKCKLTEINSLDKDYEGFTMQNIGLASPAGKMQKEYTITLKLAVAKGAKAGAQ